MSSSSLSPRKPLSLVPRERWQQPSVMQVDQMVTELGGGDPAAGAQRFMALLAVAAVSDDRLDQLLAAALDPSTAGYTCGELVMAVGFRPGEILKIVKEAALAVGQAKSLEVLARSLPAIAADVATRAQVHYLPCGACDATGWITPKATKDDPEPKAEPCRACHQKGQIRMEADPARQELAFDLARMLPKGAGTSIQVNQQNNTVNGGPGSESLFAAMVRASAEILHRGTAAPAQSSAPEGETVDADVVPSPAVAPPSEDPADA